MMIRTTRVGQGEEDVGDAAGVAAGEAAAAEAQNAEWPPTRGNAEAIGAAAGGAAAQAACIAYGAAAAAPFCAYVGSVVGDFVGGAVYDLVDSWFGTSDATQRHLDSLHRKEVYDSVRAEAGLRLYQLMVDRGPKQARMADGALVTVSTPAFENSNLRVWGARSDRGYGWDIQTNEQLSESLRLVFIAESARAAEIVASNPNQSKKRGTGAVVVGVVVTGLVITVLRKIVTRGKF